MDKSAFKNVSGTKKARQKAGCYAADSFPPNGFFSYAEKELSACSTTVMLR
jgi:hypothetical protein